MKKHIVVIEDDPAMREIVEFILGRAGYRTTLLPAINTVEELIALKADCFLIDEQLPIVNGHIICIILNSKPETRDIPVILMSASDELEGYASLCEARAFLKKPFTANELKELVSSILEPVETQN